jgi:hypothetical protein
MVFDAIREYGFGRVEIDLRKEATDVKQALEDNKMKVIFWYISPTTRLITAVLR